jgi:hypothetical protein
MEKENADKVAEIRARFGVAGPQVDSNAPSSGFGQARPK